MAREESRVLQQDPGTDRGSSAPGGEEFIRFLWLRSFHDAYVFTVGMDEDVGCLRFRRFDLARGGWDPQQILFLDDVVVRDFPRASWGRQCDWSDPRIAGDGAEWIFEGPGWSAYRWSPEPGDPWRTLGLKFVALAGVEIPADEIY